jgi:hypothetical protein
LHESLVCASPSAARFAEQSVGCAYVERTPIIDRQPSSIGTVHWKVYATPGKYLLYSGRGHEMKKSEVIRLAKTRLDKVGHGIAFDVITAGVRREETWWHVPVITTRNGKDIPREITVNILANVEDDLEQKDGVSVLFIPAVAEVA